MLGTYGVTATSRLCGAYSRHNGKRCRRAKVPGRKRCKHHAGLSTGPKVRRARNMVPVNAGWRAAFWLREYAGIPHPWHRLPRYKAEDVAASVEWARSMAKELEPYVDRGAALETLSHVELLTRGSHSSLVRLVEIVEREREADDIKGERLSGEMSAVLLRMFMKVQEAQFKGQQSLDMLETILEAIEKARKEKK